MAKKTETDPATPAQEAAPTEAQAMRALAEYLKSNRTLAKEDVLAAQAVADHFQAKCDEQKLPESFEHPGLSRPGLANELERRAADGNGLHEPNVILRNLKAHVPGIAEKKK